MIAIRIAQMILNKILKVLNLLTLINNNNDVDKNYFINNIIDFTKKYSFNIYRVVFFRNSISCFLIKIICFKYIYILLNEGILRLKISISVKQKIKIN